MSNRIDKRVWGVLGKQQTFYSPQKQVAGKTKTPLNANAFDSWDVKRSRFRRVDGYENAIQQGGTVIGQTTPSPDVSPTPTPTPSITASATLTPTPTTTSSSTPTPTTTPTLTPSPTNTSTTTPTPTPSSSQIASGTTEAINFLNRVVQSGGTVDATASAATITLFTSLVSNGLWDKMYGFYPVLGGVAASHSINGKSPDGVYDLVFNGGWTHSSSGMEPNGTNGYADTSFNPFATIGNGGTSHLSIYVNLQGSVGNRIYDMGINSSDASLTDQLNLTAKRVVASGNNTLFDCGNYDPSAYGRVQTTSEASASGMTVGSYRSATDKILYRDGNSIATQTNSRSSTYTNNTLFVGAQRVPAGASYFSSNRYAFATIGSGLTNTEIVNLSNIINTYETSLGRNTY